jgi:hypothetical protein
MRGGARHKEAQTVSRSRAAPSVACAMRVWLGTWFDAGGGSRGHAGVLDGMGCASLARWGLVAHPIMPRSCTAHAGGGIVGVSA